MKASEAIEQIKIAVDDFSKTGNTAIPVQNMQLFLEDFLRTTKDVGSSEAPLTDEQTLHQPEIWKAKLVSNSGMSIEMFKSVLEAGQTAIKSSMLLNGGSAVAMLAFVGNILANVDRTIRPALLVSAGGALLCFALGAGLSGCCSAFRYLSQESYSNAHARPEDKKWMKWGVRLQWFAISLALGSFASFFAGAITAYRAIVAI